MRPRDWYPALSRVNLNQLLSFLVVAEEKSFRAAATRMHLSQSAVSVQVQQLEAVLGVALFHRTTRSVALTREGLVLADAARRLTDELVDAANALREQAALQRGLVRVVAMPTFAYMLLPELMSTYARRHPQVDVRLLDVDSTGALPMLQQGEADLAVLARTPDMDDFDFTHLFRDELVVLAPAGSQLFADPQAATPQEVVRQRLVLTPRGTQTRALVEGIFNGLDEQPRVQQECHRPQTLLALVEHGFGLTILPSTAVVDINLSRLRVVRLATRPMREVGIVTMRNLALSPAARSFKEYLGSVRYEAARGHGLGFAE